MPLPAGLPDRIDGPSVWTAADMQHAPRRWRTDLSPTTIAELRHAARVYLDTGRDVGAIAAADFPLPTFAAHLRSLRHKLVQGVGVEVLRGLPVAEMEQAEAAAVFCGIGAHLGAARSQNAAGHILGHVRDTGANSQDATTRIYQTSARQTFHTDSADVVALLCLRDAQAGGESLLVSAEAICNRMHAERPDLLARLFDPIATDRRGEIPEGMKPWMEIPPFNWHDGRLTVFYQRQYIDSAQRLDSAPRLTPDHVAALDMFDALANDPEMHITMRLAPGDMQFVYNHALLHDRTGFTDWPDPDRRRHLLRLWLSIPCDRALPECFKQRYGSIEPGNRGGIVTSVTRLHAPLD